LLWEIVDRSMTAEEEVPLTGGRMTTGIVRIGDTVRRPSKASSPFVAQVLAHLHASECSWAPRYLGQDELRRDVLSYLPGTVPPKWVRFSDRAVCEAALILRRLHDATRGSHLAPDGVVCHNDPGPNNFVFVDDTPVALIDFDFAMPGEPLEDVGYLAWSWCVSSKPERGPVAAQAQQVRTMADAYGLTSAERERLPDWIIERQIRNVRFWSEQLANPGDIPTGPAKMREVIEWSEREARYTQAHRSDFLAALLA
jgi:Ser/Thr protein kinase RdoA (MazF antagonist)